MHPRSLLVPPGVPDFMSRARHLAPGPCLLQGRAWSGWGAIEAVEVSADGGATWAAAALDEAPPAGAWRGWRFEWDAVRGEHELCSRARDAAGNAQPVEAEWNVGGYANTSVQRRHGDRWSTPWARREWRRAIVLREFGSPERLVLEDVAAPVPGPERR